MFKARHEKSYLILRYLLGIDYIAYLSVAKHHDLIADLHQNVKILADE